MTDISPCSERRDDVQRLAARSPRTALGGDSRLEHYVSRPKSVGTALEGEQNDKTGSRAFETSSTPGERA